MPDAKSKPAPTRDWLACVFKFYKLQTGYADKETCKDYACALADLPSHDCIMALEDLCAALQDRKVPTMGQVRAMVKHRHKRVAEVHEARKPLRSNNCPKVVSINALRGVRGMLGMRPEAGGGDE